MKSFNLIAVILLIAARNELAHAQGMCGGGIEGDNPVSNLRPDHQTTFATDDSFLLVSAGVVNCYGHIDRWQWYHGNQPGTCLDITFQVWRPTDIPNQDYMLVGENTLTAGVDFQCSVAVGGGTITKVMWEGYPIPVIPGDVYGWRDTVGMNRPMIFSEAILPGSGFFGTTLVLSSLDTCPYTVGDSCSWKSTFSGGQADLWSRAFSLNARVSDLNLDPYFNNLAHDATVYENAAKGTFVFNVIGNLDYNSNDVIPPPMNYRITATNPNGACANKFEIDPYSGNVTTCAEVDFEALGNARTCRLTIEAWLGPWRGNRDLTITVMDVNEQHVIDNLDDDIAIDAAATNAGVTLFTITEDEPDIVPGPPSNWQNHQYRMTNSLPYFDLFQIGTPANDEISSTQNLANYVSFPNYTLSLTSYDDHHISGPRKLNVFIYNMRTKPVLTNVPGTVTIPETSAVGGTQVFNVDGSRQPDNRGGALVYVITNVYPEKDVGKFVINGATGMITHVANPGFNHFTDPEYKIEVEARNGDGLFTSDRYNVTVEITWVNTAPVFTSAAFSATIPENETVGTEVPGIFLDGTDRDTVIGDWFFYNIYQPEAYRFWPSNITNKVYVNHDLTLPNGVASTVYNLIVQVQDQYGEVGTAPLTITVLDVNDNTPVFNPKTYTGSVSEADYGDTYTGVTVTATDADAGINADIRYKIEGDLPNLYFEIDPVSGRITLKQPIAYHEYPNMTFKVLAEDQGFPTRCDYANVTINVIEINNNKPRFNDNFYSLEIRSDLEVGSHVLTVTATDNDTDAVNAITYMYIVLQDEFNIGVDTGTISLAEEVDHYKTFLLYIYAKDNGVPVLYSDPLHVRIDTYDPHAQLIDIQLKMPLKEFLPRQEQFMDQLRTTLAPWNVKLESALLDGDETVVSIYAMKNNVPDDTDYVEMKKEFVDKEDVLEKLRSNFYGNPTTSIRGSSYAEYQPRLVEPYRKNWWIHTAGGITLLVFLCLLALGLLIAGFVLLTKYKGWLCFKKPTKPPAAPQGGPSDGYKLKYDLPKKTQADEIAISKNIGLYGGAGVIPPAPITSSTPPEKAVYNPSKGGSGGNPLLPVTRGDQYSSTRRTPHAEGMRSLTPVNKPDSQQQRPINTVADLRHH